MKLLLEWGQNNYWLGTFPFIIFLYTQNQFCLHKEMIKGNVPSKLQSEGQLNAKLIQAFYSKIQNNKQLCCQNLWLKVDK